MVKTAPNAPVETSLGGTGATLGELTVVKEMLGRIPGVLWVTDSGLNITALYGRRQRRFQGASIVEVMRDVEGGRHVLAAHRAALGGHRTRLEVQLKKRWFQTEIAPVRAGDGTIVGCAGMALDVTRHKLREERLRKSEARLAESQQTAHVGSWHWEIRENRVTWSDEMFRIYGLGPDTFGGTYEAFLAAVYPDDVQVAKTVMLDAMRRPGPFTYEHRIRRSDGAVRMLHTRGAVQTDATGHADRMVGTCWDITESWEAHRALEDSRSLLEAALDATADGLLVVGLDGKVLAHNRRFLSLWRIPDAQVAQEGDEGLLRLVTDQLEDPDEFLSKVRELYSQPETESSDVITFRDGRIFERYSLPQRVRGKTVGRVWSFRDVTERERLYRRATLLSDASRLLAVLDSNQAMAATANLTVQSIAEGCAIDLMTEAEPLRLSAAARPGSEVLIPTPSETALTGRPVQFTRHGRTHISVPLMLRGRPAGAVTLVAPAGKAYTEIDFELADELGRRISLSLENAHLYEGAKQALRARDEFLSVVGHEVRGPLTSMRLAITALRRELQGAEEVASHPLDVLEREERRLARFIEQLLDLGRVRRGLIPLQLVDVDLVEVTRDTLSRLAPDIERAGSTVSMDAPGPIVGTWDRDRLEQVLSNLISNALKYGQGAPVQIKLSREGDEATFEIVDHGIGIAKGQEERIFEPFERAVPDRQYGGLGLGLFIARSIVRAFGGTLTAQSRLGGTVFVAKLPVRKVET